MVEKSVQDREGSYVSLSGRKGHNGLKSNGTHNLSVIATGTPLLLQNGARVHATIRNMTSADGADPQDFTLCLAGIDEGLDCDQQMLMRPGDVFVIDVEHPWSGAVTGYTQIGTTSGASVVEVSLNV
jgi:hypothetical protein